MYESPIKLFISDISQQIARQQDEHTWQAIVQCVPNVDKEELIRALQYDREQYEKGYADAMAFIVRCKNCKHCSNNTPDGFHWCDEHERGSLCDDDFCSYGERREGE